MKVRLSDPNDLCRYIVTSESEGGVEYEVDLCQYELGLDNDGLMQYNGACICTRKPDQWLEKGCPDFIYRCEPKLRRPENMGKQYRCKHLVEADKFALRLLKPQFAKQRQNLPDDQLP